MHCWQFRLKWAGLGRCGWLLRFSSLCALGDVTLFLFCSSFGVAIQSATPKRSRIRAFSHCGICEHRDSYGISWRRPSFVTVNPRPDN
jgi:hypothetical protein